MNLSSLHDICSEGTKETGSTCSSQRHFKNCCLTQPGKFSCAVNFFLELAFAIFEDCLKQTCINGNEFFQNVLKACLRWKTMTEVREPVWTYLRQLCNFCYLICRCCIFSEIFASNTVGVMTQELKSLFLVQKSNQSVCSSYNNAISNKTSSFVV